MTWWYFYITHELKLLKKHFGIRNHPHSSTRLFIHPYHIPHRRSACRRHRCVWSVPTSFLCSSNCLRTCPRFYKFPPNSWATCAGIRVELFQNLPQTLYINITFKPSFLPSFLLHRHHLRHHRQFLVFLVGDKNKNISIWFLWRNFILGLLLFCGWSFEVYTFSEFGRIIRLRCSPPRGFEVGVALSSSTSCYCWTEIMWTLLLILSLGSRLILTDKLAYT